MILGGKMIQPTKEQVTEKLLGVLEGIYSREFVGKWALNYITNDDEIENIDIVSWDYLVTASSVDEMISPTVYLYSIEDIRDWIEYYDLHNKGNGK